MDERGFDGIMMRERIHRRVRGDAVAGRGIEFNQLMPLQNEPNASQSLPSASKDTAGSIVLKSFVGRSEPRCRRPPS